MISNTIQSSLPLNISNHKNIKIYNFINTFDREKETTDDFLELNLEKSIDDFNTTYDLSDDWSDDWSEIKIKLNPDLSLDDLSFKDLSLDDLSFKDLSFQDIYSPIENKIKKSKNRHFCCVSYLLNYTLVKRFC